MTLEEFDQYCKSLPQTTHVVQWGNAHVWKIGDKVFAIAGWNNDSIGITFKCEPAIFHIMKNAPGLRPAPYLASRGLSWLQWIGPETLCEDELKDFILQSYQLVASSLSKTKRRELGL